MCFGVVNFVFIFCIYGLFIKLFLGDVIVCIFIMLIFIVFLVYVFLKEFWYIFDVVVIFICFGGVVLIMRLSFLFGFLGKKYYDV